MDGVAAGHGESLAGAGLSSGGVGGREGGREGRKKYVQAKTVPLYPRRTESTTALATRS